MRFSPLITVCAAALLLGGCVRSSSLSEITSTGAVNRKLTITVTDSGMGGENKPKPEDFLILANPGAWKVSAETKEMATTMTASRTMAPGAPKTVEYHLSDGKKGKAKVEVGLITLPNGDQEYTETWTWEGKDETLASDIIKDVAPILAKHLKPLGASDAKITESGEFVKDLVIKIMMGPSEPMLMQLITEPEEGLRQFRRKVYLGFAEWIRKEIPGTDEVKAKATAKAWAQDLQKLLEDKQTAATSPSSPPGDEGQLVIIQSAIKGNGQVVETNGVLDEVDDRVYWSMYLEACSNKPVVLRAVFKK